MVETLEPAVEPRKGVKARKRRAFVMEVAIVAIVALLLLIVIPPLLSALGQGVRVNQLGRWRSRL